MTHRSSSPSGAVPQVHSSQTQESQEHMGLVHFEALLICVEFLQTVSVVAALRARDRLGQSIKISMNPIAKHMTT